MGINMPTSCGGSEHRPVDRDRSLMSIICPINAQGDIGARLGEFPAPDIEVGISQCGNRERKG